MKKVLLLLMALLSAAAILVLAACSDDTPTTTEPKDSSSDAISDTAGNHSTTPATSTNPPVVTTPVVTTPATPNTRDSAKEYHQEPTLVKTNSKNEDEEYILIDNAGSNLNERFADGEGYILYEFDLSDMIEPTITFKVRQQYVIYVTDNLEDTYEDMHELANFMDIADQFPSSDFNENGEYIDGNNIIEITLDPYELGYYGTVFVYIANCQPQFGHGGTIMSFTINQWVEGKGPEITTIDNSNGTPNYKTPDMTQTSQEFVTGAADEDEAYIFENTSQTSDNRRYADKSAFLIYRIDLRELVEPTVELYVVQNYKIEVSLDGSDWKEIANYSKTDEYNEKFAADGSNSEIFAPSGDYLTGDNYTTIVIDPYEYEIYGNLYIRISDCFPADGWGGAIEKLTIKSWS